MSRHRRLAVGDREGGQLPEDDVARNAEGCNGVYGGNTPNDLASVLREPVQRVLRRIRERDVRSVESMDPAARRCRIVHAHVVQIAEQDSEAHDELPAVAGARRQEPAAGEAVESDDAGRYITRMNDPVVGEERRM